VVFFKLTPTFLFSI